MYAGTILNEEDKGEIIREYGTMDKVPVNKRMYAISLMRVCLVVFAALVLPRFFFQVNYSYRNSNSYDPSNGFRLGIENISKEFLQSLNIQGRIDGYRVGIITNHTGIDQQGKSSIDILWGHGLHIKKIYVPENDIPFFTINKENQVLARIPIAVLSDADSLKSCKEYSFDDIDVLFVDMQEPGITPNKYVTTLLKILQSAASQNKTVVVLDRPNILGATMEGMAYEFPLRSGMTIGELSRYFNNAVLTKTANLFVVPMQKYDRVLFADSCMRGCGSLMTNIDTYYGSSFLPILGVVAPFDVGVGTDMEFHCLALPESLHVSKQTWFQLRTILRDQGLESSWVTYLHPKKRIPYSGLRILVPHIDQFSSFNTIVTIIHFFKQAGVKLTYGSEFEQALGGKKMREFLENKISVHDLESEVNKELKNFFTKAQSAFMYKPIPKMVFM